MKKRMMKICYMMTLAAVLCTSGTTGVNGKEYRSKDTADSKISIEGSIKEWNVKMKIVNQTGKKLPDTGSAGKPVLLTGILAVGIMAMIYRKKEQKR